MSSYLNFSVFSVGFFPSSSAAPAGPRPPRLCGKIRLFGFGSGFRRSGLLSVGRGLLRRSGTPGRLFDCGRLRNFGRSGLPGCKRGLLRSRLGGFNSLLCGRCRFLSNRRRLRRSGSRRSLRRLGQRFHADQPDRTRRALVHALAAELTLLRVDIGEVVRNRNRVERAHLLALAAADTSGLAGFHHHGALCPSTRTTRIPHGSWATSCAAR